MDLKEFIKAALVAITEGVREANRQVQPQDTTDRHFLVEQGNGNDIVFDIAVVATNESGAKGGGGLKVWSVLDASGEKSSKTANETTSRIKFHVNVNRLIQ